MQIFECQNCSQPLYFENTSCESCGLQARLSAGAGHHHGAQGGRRHDGSRWRSPKAAIAIATTPSMRSATGWCRPTSPDSSASPAATTAPSRTCRCRKTSQHWRKIEVAKHRLFYTLLKFKLPLATKAEEPDALAFDFVADQNGPQGHIPVLTGHDDGLITINIAEADDPERERRAARWASPTGRCSATSATRSRTTTGTAWWRSRRASRNSATCSATSSRTTARRCSSTMPTVRRRTGRSVSSSSYASSHPWEDFAETWAHYLHMIDTLETASAFGLSVRPKVGSGEMAAKLDFDPHGAEMTRIIDAWLPLTYAMNSINRSMGLQDLYPFVLEAAGHRQAHLHPPAHAPDRRELRCRKRRAKRCARLRRRFAARSGSPPPEACRLGLPASVRTGPYPARNLQGDQAGIGRMPSRR